MSRQKWDKMSGFLKACWKDFRGIVSLLAKLHGWSFLNCRRLEEKYKSASEGWGWPVSCPKWGRAQLHWGWWHRDWAASDQATSSTLTPSSRLYPLACQHRFGGAPDFPTAAFVQHEACFSYQLEGALMSSRACPSERQQCKGRAPPWASKKIPHGWTPQHHTHNVPPPVEAAGAFTPFHAHMGFICLWSTAANYTN